MTYDVIGLMSGTSMDGVDLCQCQLSEREGVWSYRILAAATYPYTPAWRQRLDAAILQDRDELADIDEAYAEYLATLITRFREGKPPVSLVASHGHTVHHVPAEGYTRQIGRPQVIADLTGLPIVGDFRTADVALGGQGAPLVPLVDHLLFSEFAACVNLGGFANVSFARAGHRVAGDVSVCNLLSDRLAAELGEAYDAGGRIAQRGHPQTELLTAVARLPYFTQPMPKSLGREWFEREVWPSYAAFLAAAFDRQRAVEDALATAGTHLARELAHILTAGPSGRILVTGGGAYNDFVMDGLRQNLPADYRVERPEAHLVEYKEALAFALLGVLRLRGETNVLATVTGASRDSSSGVICTPSKAATQAFGQV